MNTKRVEVKVYEDGVLVGVMDVGYFDQQPYTVDLITPEGVDATMSGIVGATEPFEAVTV